MAPYLTCKRHSFQFVPSSTFGIFKTACVLPNSNLVFGVGLHWRRSTVYSADKLSQHRYSWSVEPRSLAPAPAYSSCLSYHQEAGNKTFQQGKGQFIRSSNHSHNQEKPKTSFCYNFGSLCCFKFVIWVGLNSCKSRKMEKLLMQLAIIPSNICRDWVGNLELNWQPSHTPNDWSYGLVWLASGSRQGAGVSTLMQTQAGLQDLTTDSHIWCSRGWNTWTLSIGSFHSVLGVHNALWLMIVWVDKGGSPFA